MDAAIASGLMHSPEPLKIANTTYDNLLGLTLPYMVKKDNINEADKARIRDPNYLKKVIELRKKKLAEQQAAEKAKTDVIQQKPSI